jgi:two-component system chemotaxis response regulator CheY
MSAYTKNAMDLRNLETLIVDDSVFMRRIMRILLRGFGIGRATEAENGEQALEKLDSTPYDLVIADLFMPGMNGFDFLKALRVPKNMSSQTPVIIVTAHSEKHILSRCLIAGAHDVIKKPVPPKRLYTSIIDCFKFPRNFIKADDFYGPEPRPEMVDFVPALSHYLPHIVEDKSIGEERVKLDYLEDDNNDIPTEEVEEVKVLKPRSHYNAYETT